MVDLQIYRIDSDTREVDESTNSLPKIETQQALVIGVDIYSESFRRLNNAVSDAQAIARVLSTEYGFTMLPGENPLLNSAAELGTIQQTIQDSLSKGNSQTRWLFYFAGHGLVVEKQLYLLPANAEKGDPKSYLSLSWLLEICRESRIGEILIILDACYSGWAMVRSEGTPPLNDQMTTSEETRVRQLISAGMPAQPVLDAGGTGHSVFTQALLDSLEGYSGVHESNGRIRFAPLLDQLYLEIPQRLRAAGLETYQQQPIGGYFSGNNARRGFIFCAREPRLPPDTIRDLASLDSERRVVGLKHLKVMAENQGMDLALTTQAIQISSQRLLSALSGNITRGLLRFETDPVVRAQAASTLGELLVSLFEHLKTEFPQQNNTFERLLTSIEPDSSSFLSLNETRLGVPYDLIKTDDDTQMVNIARQSIIPALQGLLHALGDVPAVTRVVASVLGRLALPITARPLLERYLNAPDELFLDFAGSLGAIGEPQSMATMLSEALQRGKLVPFIGPDLPEELTGVKSRADFIAEFAKNEGCDVFDSLARVTEKATRGGHQRYSLVRALKDAYDDPLHLPSSLYTMLKTLDVPFWLSACYDNLLTKSIDANQIVMGEDTKYWRTGRPTVVRLVGDPSSIRGLVVIEKDYELLRENEGDRKLLLGFLQQELRDKVVLLIGFDPASPDFALLVKYILNQHLSNLYARAFLVWPTTTPILEWGEHPIYQFQQDPFKLLKSIQASGDEQSW